MGTERPTACALHGAGMRPETLIDRQLQGVVGSWCRSPGAATADVPQEVWLISPQQRPVYITTGSDWCLIVEESDPHTGYDMGSDGRVEVAPIGGKTPLADHIGERVLEVVEEHTALTGRMALEMVFPSGRVRCESWGGALRLSGQRPSVLGGF